jgi:hypothetical protein
VIMKNLFRFRSILSAVALALFFLSSRAQGAPGDLYVAEPTGGGNVYKFTPDGTRSTFASGIYQPVALAFDRAGNLFVGNSGAHACIPEQECPPVPSTVIKIAPDGTQTTFATLPLQVTQLLSIAFDGAGNLFVSTSDSIVKIAPDGTQSIFASGLQGAWPLAFDRSGNLFVGENPAGASLILKFAPDGSHTTFKTFPAPGSSIATLAFGPGGDLFVVRGGSILKVRPDGSTTTFASGDFQYSPLAFDTSGTLFAGRSAFNSNDPAIVKFTPNGTATTFATGVLLPAAFAFEPVREKIRNVSARGLVGSGENVLIGGFIVGGSALANNAVVVRAMGPSLSPGVSSPLSDPVLELRDSSGAIVASNNDWEATQKAQITAAGLAPADPRESAIFATLPAGDYTAVVLSADGKTGLAVVEVYSVNQ